MARKLHRVKPEASKIDALAYYTAQPVTASRLRAISPLEQMYGYYNAE